jgi:hypothetical protein
MINVAMIHAESNAAFSLAHHREQIKNHLPSVRFHRCEYPLSCAYIALWHFHGARARPGGKGKFCCSRWPLFQLGECQRSERGGKVLSGRAQICFSQMGLVKSKPCSTQRPLGATMIATAEAFVLAEKLGLSHQALFDVASVSSGQSGSLTTYCPVPGLVPGSPANNGYMPGFAAAMLKDLKLAQEAAANTSAATPLGAAATQLYALYNASGEGNTDFSAIIKMIRGKT